MEEIFMQWSEVKEQFPAQWVLIEAIDATSKDNMRVVEQVSVVDTFANNGDQAMLKYVELHKQYKNREFYVVHTLREQLDIKEQVWIGVRATR
jgi:hypothetical protein